MSVERSQVVAVILVPIAMALGAIWVVRTASPLPVVFPAPPCTASALETEVKRLKDVLDHGIVCPTPGPCPTASVSEVTVTQEPWPAGHGHRRSAFCRQRCGGLEGCLTSCSAAYNSCGVSFRSVPPSPGFQNCTGAIQGGD